MTLRLQAGAWALAAVAAAVAVATSPADASTPPREIELRLYHALFRGETPEAQPASLIVLLGNQNNQWRRAYGVARDLTEDVHAGSSAGKSLDRPIHGVFAEGQRGEFFAVVTIQRGEAPEVRVQGKGLDAFVTVGKCVVRFDGEKILFGEIE